MKAKFAETNLAENSPRIKRILIMTALIMAWTLLVASGVEPPPSLKTVPIPEPPNLGDYVQDKEAAKRLGKSLFWDMRVSSDGIQACASCHFRAGSDSRTKNQLNPGPDNIFHTGGPNYTMMTSDFPFYKLSDPDNRNSTVLRDNDGRLSSQGVFLTDFLRIRLGFHIDGGDPQSDPMFHVGPVTTRRVEPRNTPTVINAVFGFATFRDGRGNFYFNGVNPFGPLDTDSGIFVDTGGGLTKQIIRIPFSSLASQAVGPPLSTAPQKNGNNNHAAVFSGTSAMTFATERVDQLNGWA